MREMPVIDGEDARDTQIPYRAALLLFASTLAVMAGSAIAPVVELMRGDLGLDATAAGLILTMHGLAIAIISPLAGSAAIILAALLVLHSETRTAPSIDEG